MTDSDLELESYKRQESALILLSMMVLGALILVHVGFLPIVGKPSATLLAILAGRFIMLVGELLWVQKLHAPLRSSTVAAYTHFSIWLNIGFAFLASYFSGLPDSHYSVLLVIPIISAAYRFTLPRTIFVVAVAVSINFLEVWMFFYRNPPADGSEYFEAASVSLIFLVVAVVVWLLVDYLRKEEAKLRASLAELKLAQSRLVAEEKLAAVGRLSSAIAHEIRNPVAMIASSLDLASRETQQSPLREEMFGIATEEAARLEKLTTDFLSYARVKELDKKETPLAPLLDYISSLTKARAAESSVSLKTICAENLAAEIDASQIQQALLNLMMNALDATPAGGAITLGASPGADETVELFVENSGAPIDEGVGSRIFEPFFTNKSKGTGLGLAIVRNTARAHGGEAFLASNEPNRVRFVITLPQKSKVAENFIGETNGTNFNR
jgi:signal transduction histidine kinase